MDRHLDAVQAREHLDRLRPATTVALVCELFDRLPAVPTDAMLGAWRGKGLATGHPLDGLLERYRWHGKRFDSAEAVHPLVMADERGRFAIDPARLPFGLALARPDVAHNTAVTALSLKGLRLLTTRRPQARLRAVTHRGVTSAAMIYDRIPVIDHFRAVDDDTVLGLMDLRGSHAPFAFTLTREG